MNTASSPVPLQTERASEPHPSPAVQVTETPKIPAEPLIALTPKSPADISAGRWQTHTYMYTNTFYLIFLLTRVACVWIMSNETGIEDLCCFYPEGGTITATLSVVRAHVMFHPFSCPRFLRDRAVCSVWMRAWANENVILSGDGFHTTCYTLTYNSWCYSL